MTDDEPTDDKAGRHDEHEPRRLGGKIECMFINHAA
jgi:hypothetical protein